MREETSTPKEKKRGDTGPADKRNRGRVALKPGPATVTQPKAQSGEGAKPPRRNNKNAESRGTEHDELTKEWPRGGLQASGSGGGKGPT